MTSAFTAQAPGVSAANSAMSKCLRIRDAEPEDMLAVQEIYAHHVLHGTASFEETPPSVHEMQKRRENILAAGMPYLVATLDDEVVGYSYASLYRPRAAYRYTLEDSIYLAPAHTGKGVGKALLAALIERCSQGPWRQMIAVIAGQDNRASIGLHQSQGFVHAGTQFATGFKFDQWIDVVFMQRAIGAGSDTRPDC